MTTVTILTALAVFALFWLRFGLNLRDCRRVFKTCVEFFCAYRALQGVGPSVTFFSSARLKPEMKSYQLLMRTANKLAAFGYSVFHGAGPGGMEAVARGAQEGAARYRARHPQKKSFFKRNNPGPRSIGLAIELPFEQEPNTFCDLVYTFRSFFTRKVCLVRYSKAIIIGLGGYGTLDETFEALTLMQCQHHGCVPVYLLDDELAQPLLRLVGELYGKGMISLADVERLVLVGKQDTLGLPVRVLDSEDEMIEEIRALVPISEDEFASPLAQAACIDSAHA